MPSYRKLKLAVLHEKCQEVGLSTSGKRIELIQRLEQHEDKGQVENANLESTLEKQIKDLQKAVNDLRLQQMHTTTSAFQIPTYVATTSPSGFNKNNDTQIPLPTPTMADQHLMHTTTACSANLIRTCSAHLNTTSSPLYHSSILPTAYAPPFYGAYTSQAQVGVQTPHAEFFMPPTNTNTNTSMPAGATHALCIHNRNTPLLFTPSIHTET